MGVLTVKPDHHAVEAARREVFSSLVSKYMKEIGRHALRLSQSGNNEVVKIDLFAAITKSQLRAFHGTDYAEGLDDAMLRQKIGREVIRVLRRIRLG